MCVGNDVRHRPQQRNNDLGRVRIGMSHVATLAERRTAFIAQRLKETP
jgi:hypothetical protein